LLLSFCYLTLRQVLQLLALRVRSNDFKDLEILGLRHELEMLRRRTRRPAIAPTDRLFLTAASRLLPRARWHAFLGSVNRDIGARSYCGRQPLRQGLSAWSQRDSDIIVDNCPAGRREATEMKRSRSDFLDRDAADGLIGGQATTVISHIESYTRHDSIPANVRSNP
jgi:hypothetical protein